MDPFRHSFREEARELLADLEAALLELNENREDRELISRVFRALHTIKGSGAMFGFERLAAFTHNLENAFDEVRNGRIPISAELIDLTLSALDLIRSMVEENEGEQLADPVACESILGRAREIIGRKAEPTKTDVEISATPTTDPRATERRWKIHFAPGPDLMRTGSNPLLLIRELAQLGELSVTASMASVPGLTEIDPERCYVSWEMTLITAAGEDAIRDVFIFVEDLCELTIESPAPEAAADLSVSAKSVALGRSPCESELTARALEDKRAQSGGRRTYDKPDNTSSLRVPASKLDQFVNLVGELVTVQARLSEIAARRDDIEITSVAEEVERLAASLRENSMNIRMMPIRGTFEKFRRLVHDLARDLDKNVELTIEGADTELDKTVIDQLSDPLMHLIRNSMDHGIEPAEVRSAAGKNPIATIHLSARYSGASVQIGVSDDGGGIDADAVRRKAIEKGLITAESSLEDSAIYALIFQPGFSTAKQVTDISGRGVGMDVVRQNIESLRGTIDVQSQPGQGTSVTLRLPLTLAIIDGLLVKVNGSFFVMPLANILECIELTSLDIEEANGKHVSNLRGEVVPYIRLREYFGIGADRPEIEQIMIVDTGEGGRYGFVVDQVLGNCQTVIKNLGRFYRHVQVVSGATILGDGTVALILDPWRLAQEAVRTLTVGARHQNLPGALPPGAPLSSSPVRERSAAAD